MEGRELTDEEKLAIRAAIREVDLVQMAIIRKLTPAQRTAIALSMIEAAETAAVTRLRQKEPHLSVMEALRKVRSRA